MGFWNSLKNIFSTDSGELGEVSPGSEIASDCFNDDTVGVNIDGSPMFDGIDIDGHPFGMSDFNSWDSPFDQSADSFGSDTISMFDD